MIFWFFFKRRWIGVLLILLGIGCGIVLLTARSPEAEFEKKLQALPDHDSCACARRLFAEKKFGEAKTVCEDIIAWDLPGKKAAVLLAGMCEKELSAVHRRLWRSVQAFVSGNPGDSLEEAGAALLSDMLMYGDIRDLVMQGYFKVTGKETDPFVAALAAGGLATELVDAADWMPALMKIFRKSKVLSDKLVLEVVQSLKKTGEKAGNIAFFKHTKELFNRSGYVRTKVLLRQADRTEDFVKIAKFAEKSAAGTHLLVRTAGKNTLPVINKMAAEKKPFSFLRRLLSKGPNGITLYLRSGKTLRKGNAAAFVNRAAQVLKDRMGFWVWLIPMGAIGIGVVLTLPWHRKRKMND